MPIYEFSCSVCGRSFEELVRSSDATGEVICPTCGSRDIRRKISVFAAKVSGGGAGTAAAVCAPGGT